MRRAWTLASKELGTFFHSPLAYAVAAVFLFLAGYFFRNHMAFYHLVSLRGDAAGAPELRITPGIIRPLYESTAFLLLMVIPFITMRLLSEEKRNRSLELLLSYPLRVRDILAGKFIGAYLFFLILLLPTLLFPAFLFVVGDPDPGPIAASYAGLLLLGGAFLSVGLLVSSMTENPVAAAAGTFGFLLLVWTVGFSATMSGPRFSPLLEGFSFLHRYGHFTTGIIDSGDIVFFVAWIFFPLFLAGVILSSPRLRGGT